MRSTRETELAEEFPMHVVCRWIGNSQPVAAKHYLQLTDEHFQKATETARKNETEFETRNSQQEIERDRTKETLISITKKKKREKQL